jgi:hypothetical protein
MINRNRWTPRFVLGTMVIALLLLASLLPASQDQPAPAPAKGSSQDQSKTAENNKPADTPKQNGEAQEPASPNPTSPTPTSPTNDRLFYTLPNYLTVENASQLPPLTAGQKFKLVAQGSFDPVEYPFVGVVALIGQGRNDEASFGQGARGYAKRYAVDFTDNTIGNFMANATLPWLLRQDPRYYQLGKGGFVHRALYAASRILVTRTDSGKKQFNYSEIAGNALAGAISNIYHPQQDRTVSNTVSVWWTEVAWDAAGFEMKEFWPDLRRYLHKKRPANP